MVLMEIFVIPKGKVTPSKQVWEMLIQPCDNPYADWNGRRFRIQT
jgi:hypothetical protein